MDSDKRDDLFLDDLYVGQIFTSASLGIDADQIKRFAQEFDPQPFHLSADGAASRCSPAWPPAADTPPLSRCGCL